MTTLMVLPPLSIETRGRKRKGSLAPRRITVSVKGSFTYDEATRRMSVELIVQDRTRHQRLPVAVCRALGGVLTVEEAV